MKIAVTSQNRKSVTGHAGRCRKFWIFDIDNGQIVDRKLLELPPSGAFYDSSPDEPHPLDNVNLLITAGMGQGLVNRLQQKGIESLVSEESDPERAVLNYLMTL